LQFLPQSNVYLNIIDVGMKLLIDSRKILDVGDEDFVEQIHLPELLVIATLSVELRVD
jgi:hypothetical protein